MPPVIVQLTTLLVLALTSLATGLLLARALRLRRLERLDATAAAGSVLLGFLAWTVAFSLLSEVGRLAAPTAVVVILLAHVVLLPACWQERRSFEPRGPRLDWVILGTAVGLTTTLALLPVLLHSSFLAANDTFSYCALARWLQDHGFGEPAEPGTLGGGIARLYQNAGYPLGAAYPLALAGTLGSATVLLAVYPATSAMGLILVVLGLWWLARRALRLGRAVSGTLVLVFAMTPHSAYWAHHNGFLSQVYGVAGLLLGLSALAARPRLSGRLEIVTFATAAAFLRSVYVPFLGLLGAATIAQCVPELRAIRNRSEGSRLFKGWAAAGFLTLALIGFDLGVVVDAASFLERAVTVGRHIPLGPVDFASIALGIGPDPVAGHRTGILPEMAALTVAAAVLFVAGVRALWQSRRGRGVLGALVLVALLVAWNGLFGFDPWTEERGHTWRVFKAVQWAWPLSLLTFGAACARARSRRRGLLALLAVASLSLAPRHVPWSRVLAERMARVAQTEGFLGQLPDLVDAFAGLPKGQLVLLGLPQRVSAYRARFALELAQPRGLVVDWRGEAELPILKHVDAEGVVPLLPASLPFDRRARTDLGAGFTLVSAVDRPRIIQALSRLPPVGKTLDEPLVVTLTRSRNKILVLAPRGDTVEVELSIEPPAGGFTSMVRCMVVPGAAAGLRYRRALQRTASFPLRVERGKASVVRFAAEAGLNSVVLVPDAPQRLVNVTVRAVAAPQMR